MMMAYVVECQVVKFNRYTAAWLVGLFGCSIESYKRIFAQLFFFLQRHDYFFVYCFYVNKSDIFVLITNFSNFIDLKSDIYEFFSLIMILIQNFYFFSDD
jgi:hypothetical protein